MKKAFSFQTKKLHHWLLFAGLSMLIFNCNCKKKTDDGSDEPDPQPTLPVSVWTTTASQANLLYFKTIALAKSEDSRFPSIFIDSTQTFQTIDGFGYTLTGGSAMLLRNMGAAERASILEDFFGKKDKSIGVSYLRLSIGASDLDAEVFSYNDLPAGQTDPNLLKFSLSKDTQALLPILKEILKINPDIQFMASPWSAPVWMKTNGTSVGGSLKPQHYSTYAQYFVKYIQAMQAQGIRIDAVTVQNEPQHGGNNPSMVMSAAEQADFVKNHLGPAFQSAGISTKIVIWDHNCDRPDYPIEILDDPTAKKFVDGSAFHLYAGDISALSVVRDRHPDRNLYFTEQWTGKNGTFDGDLQWHIKNVIIGSMRNWARVALEWNLANDPNFGPHTPGGCTECRGAVTIDGSKTSKNVSFYIIAHAAKFVPPGSVRIASKYLNALPNVAFRRPDGKIALIVLNESNAAETFNFGTGSRWVTATLTPKTVGTFVF